MSVLLLSACNRKGSPSQAKTKIPERDYAAEGYSEASVKDMSQLDGCGFMFVLNDSTRLNPVNIIEQKFRNEGMQVWLKYRIRKGVMTTCMSGKNIDIIDIAVRK